MTWYARSMLSWRKSPERRSRTRQYGAAGPGRRELAGANDGEQEGALFQGLQVVVRAAFNGEELARGKLNGAPCDVDAQAPGNCLHGELPVRCVLAQARSGFHRRQHYPEAWLVDQRLGVAVALLPAWFCSERVKLAQEVERARCAVHRLPGSLGAIAGLTCWTGRHGCRVSGARWS